jgi:hypothetical protein
MSIPHTLIRNCQIVLHHLHCRVSQKALQGKDVATVTEVLKRDYIPKLMGVAVDTRPLSHPCEHTSHSIGIAEEDRVVLPSVPIMVGHIQPQCSHSYFPQKDHIPNKDTEAILFVIYCILYL